MTRGRAFFGCDEIERLRFHAALFIAFYWLLGVGVGVGSGGGYLTEHGVDCTIGFPTESV